MLPLLLPQVSFKLLEPNQIVPKEQAKEGNKENISQFKAGSGRRSSVSKSRVGVVEDISPESTKELNPLNGQQKPEDQKKEEVPEKPTGWQKFKTFLAQPSRSKQLIGIALMIGVGVAAVSLVSKIGANAGAHAWPSGYWYLAALAFDQGLFHPLSSLVQFSLFYAYINKPDLASGFKTLTRLVISSDILSVFDSKLNLI